MLKNNIKKSNRKAMAMPIVLLICLAISIMAVSLIFFRKESKQQNVTNFHFLRVNFLAQSAVQHLLLKLSVFPQEAYDSGVLSLGYCPFRGIVKSDDPESGKADPSGLAKYVEDCTTDASLGGIPWKIPEDRLKKANNLYRVDSLKVMNAYNDIAEKKNILTAKVVAIGEGKMEVGNQVFRKERLEKTIQLTGNN